ncbi:MAG TPA: ATP-dependent sacrificial sulfur transferase LarE [Dictyoglomaceae bacterium]|nr:ATP-dependent sacrificial sulfur transferase LarE [Dictyoglomaceae bacterium]
MEEKVERLKDLLRNMEKVVVAFSGGVDSTFLLKVAKETLGENVLAVTLVSPLFPEREIKEAEKLAKEMGVKLILEKDTSFLEDTAFLNNPPERCYLCKKRIFQRILKTAQENHINYVLDGSNVNDLGDYRPGMLALKELDIRSPLIEVGLTKGEIRKLSKELGLPTYDKPSMACLASRIPYGEKIEIQKLKRIEEGEEFLRDLGIKQVRVRDHNDTARIELEEKYFEIVLNDEVREKIVNKFKELGYTFITLDLEGYRTGSMNKTINKA